MAMERIERALELARQQRSRVELARVVAESGPVPSFAEEPPPPVSHARAPLDPVLPALQPDRAPSFALPDDARLRELRVVLPSRRDAAAESYKLLRTQVLQRVRQHGMRLVGVISAAPGEGRTLTAVNLALSLAAEPNQSVVLVDLDLRQPAVARSLELQQEAGLESYFSADAAIDTLWRRVAQQPRLTVLPTMAPLGGSSELLAGEAARLLAARLRAAAGSPLVLIDLPPALLSDDVLAVTPLLDGLLVVVAEGRTQRDDLVRLFELTRSTPVIGTVLNASADAEARER